MEFIDPQLLSYDAMQVDQPEPGSFTNFLQDDNAYYSSSPEEPTPAYAFDFRPAYPEEPLAEPAFQPNFYHDPWQFAGAGATQTDDDKTIVVATEEPAAPVRSPRYGLRPREPKGFASPSRRRNGDRIVKQNKARPGRKMEAPPSTLAGTPLSAPLSQLAEGLPNIPELDMEAFVYRERADRIMRGKITRPINAFLLYRQAYQLHVQYLYNTKDSRDVSRIVGVSWRMEDKKVRNWFHELADIEKAEHARLFPNYSYQPGKSSMETYRLS
ncbi:hypothetical protein GQX73_g4927 [Xylaria multiplex]|uniref:HMG box domain-containing protein n=1 Tax=Xylaria multiplex TaxID=323545 RepID=A0A7C8MUI6_9PEZI|nr:hypothetical protein GQX73_g4927 [Xylaria multiplex]